MSDFSYNTATRFIPIGEEAQFDITGTYVLAVDASHTDFGIRVDGGAKQFWDVGIQIGGASVDLPFRQISVVNEGATELQITLAHGRGDFADRRLTFTGGALPVSFDGPQPVTQSGAFTVEPISFAAPQPVTQSGAFTVTASFATPQFVKQSGAFTVEPISFAAPQPVTQSGAFTVEPISFAAPQPVTQSGAFTVTASFATPQFVKQSGAFTVEPISFAAPQPVTQSGAFAVEPVSFAAPQFVKQSGAFTVEPISFAASQPAHQGDAENWKTPGAKFHNSKPTVSIAAGGVVSLIVFRALRKRSTFINVGTEMIWLRSAASAGGHGVPIYPGEQKTLESGAEIFGWNPSTIPVSVAISEENWA